MAAKIRIEYTSEALYIADDLRNVKEQFGEFISEIDEDSDAKSISVVEITEQGDKNSDYEEALTVTKKFLSELSVGDAIRLALVAHGE